MNHVLITVFHLAGDCPMLNIKGYTFPVKEYLLEDVLEMTGYQPDQQQQQQRRKPRMYGRKKWEQQMEEEKFNAWLSTLGRQ